MAITADDVKQEILLEVGDVAEGSIDPPLVPEDGVVYRNIDRLWRMYAAKDQVAPGLRALYVKRAALRIILAALGRQAFDVSDVLAGLTIKANAIWQHYWDLHECCKGEISAIEAQRRVNGTPRGTALTRQYPVTPARPPDGNAPIYGGDLYGGRAPR